MSNELQHELEKEAVNLCLKVLLASVGRMVDTGILDEPTDYVMAQVSIAAKVLKLTIANAAGVADAATPGGLSEEDYVTLLLNLEELHRMDTEIDYAAMLAAKDDIRTKAISAVEAYKTRH